MKLEQVTFQTLEAVVTVLRETQGGDASFDMKRVYDAVANDPNWNDGEAFEAAVFGLKVVLLLGKLK